MRQRDLQLLVGAIFLSAVGDWLALTALALHLEETTGSGIAVSALFIALWSPLVLFAGHAGLLVDRFAARRVLVWASIAQAIVAAGLAFIDPSPPSSSSPSRSVPPTPPASPPSLRSYPRWSTSSE